MIKLVLSDLDHTLLWSGDQHIITPYALEAIHTAQDAGVHFAPATGRIYRDLDRMMAGDVRAYSTAVVSNGQLVYLDGQLVDSTPLAHEALEGLKETLASIPDAYLVVEYNGEKVAIDVDLDYVLAHKDNFWKVEQAFEEIPVQPCFKSNIRVVGSWERALEVRDFVAEKNPAVDLTCPMPGVGHIDVTPAGMGKERGAEYLMRHLGLTPDEVVCFGDAENDLSLLRHFPNSVAVANAMPAVLAATRWHIGPADEESVANCLLDIAQATSCGRMPSFMCE